METVNSLYIHFPFCRHLCNYCDFFKNIPKGVNDIKNYQDSLTSSFKINRDFLEKNGFSLGSLETIYIGGGTPSLWGLDGARYFKGLNLKKAKDCEFTLEVNPGTWTEDILTAWKNSGVNRFSLGIQTLNKNLLKYLDRVHSIKDSFETLSYFKNQGINFSVDFMLGIPQSEKFKRDVIGELKEVLRYTPDHISLYILTTKDNYKYQSELPNEEWIEREYLEVSQYLRNEGYLHYEVSNYSLPGKESRHNLKYWKAESVAAVGPSATGFLSQGDRGIRYKWKNKTDEFTVEEITPEKFKLEKFYTALRTQDGLNPHEFFSGKELCEWEKLGKKWEKSGFISSKNPHMTLSPKGYLMMDSLMEDVFSSMETL
jgi:oxygen-independent coproporphyrinogen-3 oxidase